MALSVTPLASYLGTVQQTSDAIDVRIRAIEAIRDQIRPAVQSSIARLTGNTNSAFLGPVRETQCNLIAFDFGMQPEATPAGLIVFYKTGIASNFDWAVPVGEMSSRLVSTTEPSIGKISFMVGYNLMLSELRSIQGQIASGAIQRPVAILLDGILTPASIFAPSPFERKSTLYLSEYQSMTEMIFRAMMDAKSMGIPLVGLIKSSNTIELCDQLQNAVQAPDMSLLTLVLQSGEFTRPVPKPSSKPQGPGSSPTELSSLQFDNYAMGAFRMYRRYVELASQMYGVPAHDPRAWVSAGEFYQHKYSFFKTHTSLTVPAWKIQIPTWVTDEEVKQIFAGILGDRTDLFGIPFTLALSDLMSRIKEENSRELLEMIKSYTLSRNPGAIIEFIEKQTHLL
jgi:hypothetical protein